jgi:hypothetical protein
VQPLLFQVWNEGASAYLAQNIEKYNKNADTSNPDFEEGNLKHSINGYLYCNMPDVSAELLPPCLRVFVYFANCSTCIQLML